MIKVFPTRLGNLWGYEPRLTIFNPRIFYRISASKKNLLNRQIKLGKCGRPNLIVPSKQTDLIVTVNHLGNIKNRMFRIANIASGAKSQVVRNPVFRNA